MGCTPDDTAVKKTLWLNCGNSCRKEIDICQARIESNTHAVSNTLRPAKGLFACPVSAAPELV